MTYFVRLFRCLRVSFQVQPSFFSISSRCLLMSNKRNAADANLQQFLHVGIHNLAHELAFERLETLINTGENRFVGFAFFNQLVNALLDEDAFERAVMQFVEQLLLAQFQFALEDGDQLFRVLAQDFRHGQFHRPVVFDDDDAAGDGRLAVGEGVQGIHQFFRIHARRTFDLDLHRFRSEIIDGFDLELALLHGVFDRGDERIGGRGRRNFGDDHGGFIACFDAGADFHRAFAVR